ncbi:MAG: AMP-binding protein [Spirochaetales bacterium]|nr:AMP-binding protein [Spirochaetales bacterium]
MGTILDFDKLETLWHEASHPVVSGENPLFWADFSLKVRKISGALKKREEKEWLLFTENSEGFLIGLYALLAASKEVHIPGIIPENSPLPLLTDLSDRGLSLSDLEREGSEDEVSLDHSASKIVFYTSGSTGTPKRVYKSLRQIVNELIVLKGNWGEEMARSTVYATVSHQHFYGMLFAVSLPLVSGATQAGVKVQYPESLAALPAGKKTLISSPAFLKRLDDLTNADFDDSFNFFSSGGFLPPSAAEKARALFGRDVTEIYGSTETGGIASRLSPGEKEWAPLDTVSLDLTETLCRIRSSYLESEDWENLGDLLEWGEEGRFVLKGRADSIVKVEEKRISLHEMEKALLEHPWVDDCSVLYFQGKRQFLGAAVALSDKSRGEWEGLKKLEINRELRRFLSPRFHSTLLPKKWRYPEKLPRNSMAKLQKEKVLALFDDKNDFCDEPEVLSREREGNSWTYRLCFPQNYRYFEGHFPELKILPALAQINWILLELEREIGKEAVMVSMPRIKFKNPVFPEREMVVQFSYKEDRGTLSFSYTDGESGIACSSGKINLGGE